MNLLRPRMRLVVGWVAAILLVPAIVGAREITLTEVLEHYPEEITHVRTCGGWESGDRSGSYRIIFVEFLFGGSRLWVQWMSERDQDGRVHVVYTLSPRAINDDHAEYLIEELKCRETEDGAECSFRAESGHSGEVSDVRILLEEQPGRHELLGLE